MPVTEFDFKEKYRYQNGFDSYFEQVQPPRITRVLGALPTDPWANHTLFI